MKVKIENVDQKLIEMETSERGSCFSIAFHEVGETRQDAKYWGHLNIRQCKKLCKELRHFVNRKVERDAVFHKGIRGW